MKRWICLLYVAWMLSGAIAAGEMAEQDPPGVMCSTMTPGDYMSQMRFASFRIWNAAPETAEAAWQTETIPAEDNTWLTVLPATLCLSFGDDRTDDVLQGNISALDEYDQPSYDILCASGQFATEMEQGPDYALEQSWVSVPDELTHDVDTFFILPVANMKETREGNEDITIARNASRFVKTFGMENGIVSESTDVYAPFYRQKTIATYMDDSGIISVYRSSDAAARYGDIAYGDIRNAWLHYLNHWNQGRPVVLFGYSQGAEMVLRLLSEFGKEGVLSDRLVAAYAIGYPVDDAFLSANPHLRMAQGETDTGVIISYNAVDERIKRDGTVEYAINPLNWKTDSTKASRTENLGFVVTDTYGEVTEEIPACCGAFLEPDSGLLIVTDAENQEELYASTGGMFRQGDYHLYDLNLFYRNLQRNLSDRILSFEAEHSAGSGQE